MHMTLSSYGHDLRMQDYGVAANWEPWNHDELAEMPRDWPCHAFQI
jgi:hypothetical protein